MYSHRHAYIYITMVALPSAKVLVMVGERDFANRCYQGVRKSDKLDGQATE